MYPKATKGMCDIQEAAYQLVLHSGVEQGSPPKPQ